MKSSFKYFYRDSLNTEQLQDSPVSQLPLCEVVKSVSFIWDVSYTKSFIFEMS